MAEFWRAALSALPGVLASVVVSGLLLYYLRKYIDGKIAEEEARQQEELQLRKQRSQLEMQRRRAAGRLLFWLYHSVTKPPPNGELEKAMKDYQEAEDAQKALDQKILADFETGGVG